MSFFFSSKTIPKSRSFFGDCFGRGEKKMDQEFWECFGKEKSLLQPRKYGVSYLWQCTYCEILYSSNTTLTYKQ